MFAIFPSWLKIAAVGMVGAFLLLAGAFTLGKSEGRSQATADAEIKAAKNALERINNLEKSNATFRNLTPRHRCLALMRDSGLPDSACD
nr:hypothetical protein [Agrobacterium rosae]